MAKPIPIYAHLRSTKPLTPNGAASRSDLFESAEQRMGAAKDLLWSLSTVQLQGGSAEDISHVANAAYLLLEDANELFLAARNNDGGEGRNNG